MSIFAARLLNTYFPNLIFIVATCSQTLPLTSYRSLNGVELYAARDAPGRDIDELLSGAARYRCSSAAAAIIASRVLSYHGCIKLAEYSTKRKNSCS